MEVDIRERIQRQTERQPNGCLLWTGDTVHDGYGRVWYEGKTRRVHRVVYELAHNHLPKLVRHTCDNPACCNIEHLVEGTHADNMQDRRLRKTGQRGEDWKRSSLTVTDVLEIRSSNLSKAELARTYRVSWTAINKILKRETWTHI